jgi:insulysin
LYVKAVNDAVFSITSAAEAAGAEILIKPDQLSLAVVIHGYSDQSEKITEDVLTTMKKMRPSKDQFALYRQSLASQYENGDKEMLFLQAQQSVSSLLFSDIHSPRAKREALETISFEEFNAFTKNLLTKSYVEGLLYGNLTKEDAGTLLSQVKKVVKSDGFPVKDHYEKRLLLLPENQGPFMIAQPTNMQGNVALLMVEQGPDSLETRASQQILSNVLRPDFFTTLRTQQQVAYIAKAWNLAKEDQLMQFFAVQSASHNPSDLIGRFELFLENFVKQYTTQLSPERFESVRLNAIETLRQPPENLTLNGAQLFTMGFDYDGDFALVDKRVNALENVTYDETRALAERSFSRQNAKRLALLIEGLTPKERDFRYEMVSEDTLIHDGTFVTKKEIPTSYAEIK